MGTRRGSRRRRRRPPAADTAPAAADVAAASEAAPTAEVGGRTGKAALVLALLIGTLLERIASDVIPADALNIVHIAIVVGIAFFVARWYRSFMRRTLNQRRTNRRR